MQNNSTKDLAESLGIAFDAQTQAYELEQAIEDALILEAKYRRQARCDYYNSRL